MSDYGFVIEPGTEREEFVPGGTERAEQVIAALDIALNKVGLEWLAPTEEQR